MDDETKVLIEQLKRRTANLIYEQSRFSESVQNIIEDIDHLNIDINLQTKLLEEQTKFFPDVFDRLRLLEKEASRLSEMLASSNKNLEGLNLDAKLSEAKRECEQKVAILNLTMESMRNKLEETISDQVMAMFSHISDKIDNLDIPKAFDQDDFRAEIAELLKEKDEKIFLLSAKVSYLEGKMLRLLTHCENTELRVKNLERK